MGIRYSSDNIDEILEEIEELARCVGDMKDNLKEIKTAIESTSSGKAISKIEEMMDKKIEEFTKVEEQLEEFNEYISDYIEGLKEIDEVSILSKDYYIDAKEVIYYVKKTIERLEDKRYNKLSRNFENNLDDYSDKKRKYNDVENTINIEVDYEDIDTKNYIRQRQVKIENQISDQFHNDGVMDDIKTLLRKFKD